MFKRAILRLCAVHFTFLTLCAVCDSQEAKSLSPTDATHDLQVAEAMRPAVDQLRAIAQAIKTCPRTESTRVDGVLTAGPPLNVVWDVVPAKSLRAAYMGYIEFTVPQFFSPSPKEKCKASDSDCFSRFITGLDVAAATGPWQYRYEFDVGPNGLELVKSLSKPESAVGSDWKAATMGKVCYGEDAINPPKIPSAAPADFPFDAAVWAKASAGDPDSELAVGMYFLHKKTPTDDAPGVEWIRRASNRGNDTADVVLGSLYEEGRGVNQDYGEAMAYYLSAAEHGFALAELNLAGLYYTGRGVRRDYAQAAHWYRQAAEQNNALAEVNLGKMYSEGQGVHRDEVEAYVWLSRGISGNLPADQRLAAESLRGRVESRLSSKMLREAQERARAGNVSNTH